MKKAFFYQTFPPLNKEASLRPIIRIGVGDKGTDFDALIDSGSDKTLSYVDLGETLGIDFKDKELIKRTEDAGWRFRDDILGLANDPIPVYITITPIKILNKELLVPIHWIKEPPFDPNKDFPVVLGKDSIFHMFDIVFSKQRNQFFITDKKIPFDTI